MKPDLFWIPGSWCGKLAIASRPRGGDWLDDEASAWRQAGVDIVVSLLEREEEAQLDLVEERQAAEGQAISFVSFPIPDRGVPASFETTIAMLGRIVSQLEAGKNVAVHCRQGVGRSGLIAVGVLMTSDLSAEKAIADRQCGTGCRTSRRRPNSADGSNNCRPMARSRIRLDLSRQLEPPTPSSPPSFYPLH
jgi:hypothetical protein